MGSIARKDEAQSGHEIVAKELLQRAVSHPNLLPSLKGYDPIAIKSLFWAFSQVRRGAAMDEGAIVLGGGDSGWPPLVIAGDGIAASNVDNCCFSGKRAAEKLLQELEGNGTQRKSKL